MSRHHRAGADRAELAGATLFLTHIYHDRDGELETLQRREAADDRRHFRAMESFIRHVQGEVAIVVDAEQGGWVIL